MKSLVLCFLVSMCAFAQDNPLSAANVLFQRQIASWILASAEKMPAENYSYKPTDSVRSFGQLIGHAADAQYTFCSAAIGEKPPAGKVEQTVTGKAELIAAFKDASAYCAKASESMTDAAGVQTVAALGMKLPKLSVLNLNVTHLAEHYGNIVTYLRMKNIVPPSTEAAAPPPARK